MTLWSQPYGAFFSCLLYFSSPIHPQQRLGTYHNHDMHAALNPITALASSPTVNINSTMYVMSLLKYLYWALTPIISGSRNSRKRSCGSTISQEQNHLSMFMTVAIGFIVVSHWWRVSMTSERVIHSRCELLDEISDRHKPGVRVELSVANVPENVEDQSPSGRWPRLSFRSRYPYWRWFRSTKFKTNPRASRT